MFKKSLYKLFFTFIAFNSLEGASDEGLANMQQEIKHVVFVMLENRSFDHLLGWLYDDKQGPDKFLPDSTDPHFYGLSEDSLEKYTNVLVASNGDVLYSCPPLKGLPSMGNSKYLNSPQFDPLEPFPNVTRQIYGCKGGNTATMLGFLQDYASLWSEEDWLPEKQKICAVMETYTDKELPVFYSLAKHYAVSDLWFSSVPTQTNPNRAFSLCGTSEGEIVNAALGANIFFADTLFNRITECAPQTSWAFFWQCDMLPGVIKGPYSGPNIFVSMNKIPNVDDHFETIDHFHARARKGTLPAISFIEPQWTYTSNIGPKGKDAVDLLSHNDEFLVGEQGNDMHPPGDVRTAENFLANIYTSLISNPQAWEKTLLIITFDEHGGLFDHVVPPASVSPDEHCQHGFKFDRLGVRVPAVFVSPKIDKRVVIRSNDPHTAFDHTSVLATILKWQNLPKENWRMGNRVLAAPTFEGVITRKEARTDKILVDPNTSISYSDDTDDVVKMGDLFYLRDQDGNYLSHANATSWFLPFFSAQEKVALEFVTGSGPVTHGSFSLVQGTNPSLGQSNILQVAFFESDHDFSIDTHSPDQWWTVKSLDHPYLGSPLKYGDRIYLESHKYFDVVQHVPCRLIQEKHHFYTHLTTKKVIEDGVDNFYWTIERVP